LGCGSSADRNRGDAPTAEATPADPPASSAGQGTEARMPVESQGEARFVAEREPSIILRLNETADGGITGTLSEGGQSMPLTGRRGGAGFAGTVGPAGGAMRFTATERGDRVVLEIGGGNESERLTFRRAAGDEHAAVSGTPNAGGRRHVMINERRLSD